MMFVVTLDVMSGLHTMTFSVKKIKVLKIKSLETNKIQMRNLVVITFFEMEYLFDGCEYLHMNMNFIKDRWATFLPHLDF